MFWFRSAVYREAGVRDLARMVLGYLWDWIYRSGITKQQVLDWFRKILHCDIDQGRSAGIIPTELRDAIAKIMAAHEMNCGDFMVALEEELEKPIPGYRWKTERKFGRHVLVKVRSDIGERAIVRGKRFANSIFLGAWWETDNPKGSANRRLQNLVKREGGAIFWNERRPEGGRQYGAFIIVERKDADETANRLCGAADAAALDGNGQHRLSAISMAGIAEHRDVRNSDQVWAGCIRSIKLNWEYSLPDLLNGRIEEFKSSKVYTDLIQMIRDR